MNEPDLVALCETKLHAKSTFEIKGYETRKSNLKAGKEGILVAAKEGTCHSIEIVYESELKHIVTAEIEYPDETLRIVVVHGPQEEADKEDKEEFYNDLHAEVERCLAGGKRLIITGDFNAKLSHQDGKIKESTGNGKRLKALIDKYELKVSNLNPETEGRWTRIQRKEGVECKSQIDYIITDTSIQERSIGTVIDEDKMFTPYRTKKVGRDKAVVFSDHCAITTTVRITKGSKKQKSKKEKFKYWVLTEDGMDKYQEMTQNELGLGDMTGYDEPYDVWRKKVDEIMHVCFTKRTAKDNHNDNKPHGEKALKIRKILREIGKRGKVQREITKVYRERMIANEAKKIEQKRVDNIKKTVASLTTEDKLSPNAFWKMRKSVNKNPSLKFRAIYKSNGKVTTNEDEIKDEIRKEFEHRLRNREPEECWEGYVEATNSVVEQLLRETNDNSLPFSQEELVDAISKMKKGTSPDYYGMHVDIIAKSGDGILKPLLQVLNIVKRTSKIPETWRQVLITMIYKNKGSHLNLEMYRGIFLTIIVSKLFDRMLKARMEPALKNVSLFQTGSQSGKGAPDNLFLLRSAIDHSKYMNNCLYITTYDFRQAFDSLWLQDSILVLKKLGVEDYILKLIYESNKRAQVQVKTPYGLTKPIEVKDIVKQGGILGSPMCSATTGEYCETNKGITIGTVTIASLAFVDDIADLSGHFGDVIISHENALEFAKKKKLQFAPDKCYIMLIKQKNKSNPVPVLYINGEVVTEVSAMKYLGDIFNALGNNEDLIADRIKRGTAAMVSIHGFMRETSVGPYTLSVYLLLHNAILLSSILFNCQAWSNITEKQIKELRTLQLRYLKKMMGVRSATANAFVYLELGVLPIEYEIHKRQISFLHHIINLSEDDPVKKVWRNQTLLPEHKNWWSDVKNLMKKYSILFSEEEIKAMSKDAFKQKVKEAVKIFAFQSLKEECQSKTRTESVRYEKFCIQDYINTMNPNIAKIIFKCRSKTLSIKDHSKFKHSDNLCRWCGVNDETLQHIVNCGNDVIISDTVTVVNELRKDQMEMVAERVEMFISKVEV